MGARPLRTRSGFRQDGGRSAARPRDALNLLEIAGDIVPRLQLLGSLEQRHGLAVARLADQDLGLAQLGVGLEFLEPGRPFEIEDRLSASPAPA